MATETSNIDDLLMGGTTPSIPPTSESKEDYSVSDDAPENDLDIPEREPHDDFYSTPEERAAEEDEPEEKEVKEHEEKEADYDDYGNTKAPPKTYTEEEVNERINKAVRERLARGDNKNQQPTQQQVAQQAQGFEYNPDSEESWEGQLEKFVERTVSKISQKQAQQQQQARDEQVQAEFEDKFSRGMNRFSDFREVVGSQPVTDPMTYALRGLPDPAAFIYAASKRHPQELSRISQIQDPAAQIMEMGRLEERMRKAAPGTKAPKPVSKSRDDSGLPVKGKKTEPTIEDLIAKSDAKRQALLNQKRRR
jgi:hypothetical protein